MNTPATKPKKTQGYDLPPSEVAGEILKDTVRELRDLPGDIVSSAIEQIGLKPRKGTINVRTGEHKVTEMTKVGEPTIEQISPEKTAAINRQFEYVKKQEQVVFRRETQEVEKRIQAILAEITQEVKRLQIQAAELSDDVKNITVESLPAKPGKYHVGFFEWIIVELRNIRRKVSESRMWLQVSYQKKQKRGFWMMAKKHGNTFLFSGERTVSYGAG